MEAYEPKNRDSPSPCVLEERSLPHRVNLAFRAIRSSGRALRPNGGLPTPVHPQIRAERTPVSAIVGRNAPDALILHADRFQDGQEPHILADRLARYRDGKGDKHPQAIAPMLDRIRQFEIAQGWHMNDKMQVALVRDGFHKSRDDKEQHIDVLFYEVVDDSLLVQQWVDVNSVPNEEGEQRKTTVIHLYRDGRPDRPADKEADPHWVADSLIKIPETVHEFLDEEKARPVTWQVANDKWEYVRPPKAQHFRDIVRQLKIWHSYPPGHPLAHPDITRYHASSSSGTVPPS